jgi:hypothetical protein
MRISVRLGIQPANQIINQQRERFILATSGHITYAAFQDGQLAEIGIGRLDSTGARSLISNLSRVFRNVIRARSHWFPTPAHRTVVLSGTIGSATPGPRILALHVPPAAAEAFSILVGWTIKVCQGSHNLGH